MANTFIGVGMLWGFPGTTANTIAGFSPISQIQGLEFSAKAQKDQVKDNTGNTSMIAYTDHEYNMSVDFMPNGANSLGGSLVCTVLPGIGSTLAFTDTNFTPITGTYILDDISVSRANNKAMMAKLSLSRYLNNSLP